MGRMTVEKKQQDGGFPPLNRPRPPASSERSTPLGGLGADPTVQVDGPIERPAGQGALTRRNLLAPGRPELLDSLPAPQR
jgi:hypothetical protein